MRSTSYSVAHLIRSSCVAGLAHGSDREGIPRRNAVKRCFNDLKHFRGVATRYDRTATSSYEAAVGLASFLLRVRSVWRRYILAMAVHACSLSGRSVSRA
ncbi:hypothetical protein SUDANB148_06621 [Streptomyces sp. SudanB148_2056]